MWETLHIMKRVLLAICTCKEALLRASPMEATYVAVKGHYVLSSPGCETWKLLTWKVESEICNFDCVSLCMLTRLRWIIVVSYCFARTKCCNETQNPVSLFHCRDYHIIFNRGRQLHEEDDSHTLVVALRRLWIEFQSIRPEVSSYDVISLETLVNAIAEDFFVRRFWHFWTYEIKSIAQIRCRYRDDALLCHFDLHVTELPRYFFFYWQHLELECILLELYAKCHRVPPGGI